MEWLIYGFKVLGAIWAFQMAAIVWGYVSFRRSGGRSTFPLPRLPEDAVAKVQ